MIRFFARHPTAANLLMLALLIIGLTSLPKLKRETFPEFSPPYIMAGVVYPGASPQEVEESLCVRMEDAVDGLANIEETRCEAIEGSARLILKLDERADIGRMLVDVQTQINSINDFPDEIESPVVREMDWNEPVVDVAITADTTWPELKAYAEQLKRTLKLDYGVSLVDVSGFSDHQYRVELDTIAIRQLGLSVGEIADQIGRQNVKLPSGNIETPDKNFLIRFDERRVTPEELSQIVVGSASNGSVIRLADIATITDRFELDEQKILFDGKPSAVLKISKNKADDALRIKDQVVKFVEDQRLIAPDGVTLELTNDMSSVLWDRLSMMLNNGWQGIILVFATMWLFFSFRYSFWVAAGLPVAFLGGMFLMANLGLSINIMSLVGLLMAIGIMMDDAIVIAESIASHLDRGQSVDEAVYNGVRKVFPGVLSSFLTTVCIFGSLLFLEGEMGAVLRAVPQVLILVLCLSLVEAFLILPNHLSHSLHKQKNDRPPLKFKRVLLERFEHFRNTKLVTAVSKVVEWRYAFLGGVLATLLASIALIAGGVVKFVPFPDLDGDIAEARIILPPGASLGQTEAVVDKIVLAAEKLNEDWSERVEGGRTLVQHITSSYNMNADADESGPHLATVRLDLLGAETRNALIDDFVDAWRNEVGELAQPVSLVFKQPTVGPGGRAIEIRAKHDDLEALKAASVEIQNYLNEFDGVHGVLDDMRLGKEEVLVKLRPGAETFGINGQMIAGQLRAAFFGQTADEIQIGVENIKIEVQLDKKQAGDLQQLANFPIIKSDGSQIPLGAIATLSFQRNYVRIQRIDGLRTISVYGDVDNAKASSSEIINQFRADEAPLLMSKYPGLRFDFEGEAKDAAKTGSSIASGFLLGLFGVFVILSYQFRSYLEPFVVMIAIPLALIGVIWGHFLLGHSLSMPSIMGFVSLAGIVVNDSILLVQYIRHHVDEGDSVHESVVKASRERFRAVFLTSMTTAAGLLPLLTETSLQAQVIQPLVISIVFGIFASTLLVLFMIPAAYAVLADFGLVHKHDEIHSS
ncbi:putative Acriflavin resistance protein [Vibrio nigripulchritudo SFn27]|uniref:Putative Acriflavin resistance protein n=1 Tax=Vibrio nigripulchritudo TaxID=28173 RepID=U4K103_9VIBR|nr:efflux RND transporter permease subunit [Vibrio nigripulchritudo]CCN84780.1 putative Acriflavin resistance protein [Vibrio nigripulchritudo BLFn1]CCN87727.1 putative Acriflavin resistance protein [Vibrio nigripulchritudo SFn27]CCN95777.1 putative Acriflavin resistance protein [Vibrio nigripulchritudo ENn2]CCO38935.1 putative Acriflavin resistance protein [Vibrio nigripulchritudo SFn135]CCO51894.1 putative Acriflavin resistance protein [Vibrio nigripulchritudo Wn13]